jgi:hypothetical protein
MATMKLLWCVVSMYWVGSVGRVLGGVCVVHVVNGVCGDHVLGSERCVLVLGEVCGIHMSMNWVGGGTSMYCVLYVWFMLRTGRVVFL